MKKIYIFTLLLSSLVFSLSAQTIDFEDATSYKAVGVYDMWEQSPFRTGELEGNVQVIANHLADDVNSSSKILGFQRSRLAGNAYGVKVDLNEPMELNSTVKYVHVMINRPNTGRCMLICLGKRSERVAQANTVEQTWSFASNLATDTWCDAVFQIKSFSGVEIHSFVFCPDVESPHALTSDFAVYFDDIEVNSSSTPRVLVGDYPVNAGKDATLSRSDRYINTVSVNVAGTTHTINANQQSSKSLYIDKTTDNPIPVKAGDQVTVTFAGAMSWMNGFVYIDRDNDGKFTYEGIEKGVIPEGSDVMSFSFVGGDSGYNSNGQSISGSGRNTLNPPAFTIPTDLANGIYRMRCKVDWADIDPYGSVAEGNTIVANGGVIVDVLLNVHGDVVTVSDNQLNGEVLSASDEGKLNNYQTVFGQDFTIKMNPERGFTYDGVRIRHGYIGGDSLVHGNAQYRDVEYRFSAFDENDEFTISGEIMDGTIQVEGLFVEEGHRTLYPINFPTDQCYTRSDRHINSISLTPADEAEQTITVPFTSYNTTLCYQDLTEGTDTFYVRPGTVVTPKFNWTGSSMRGFVYLDFDNDGDFTTGYTDAVGGDYVSTSLNNSSPNLNANPTLPSFTAPTTAGTYRMRYKVDWDSCDPGGKGETPNYIIDNGGSITDVILKVSGKSVPVVTPDKVTLLTSEQVLNMENGTSKSVVIGNPHKNNGYFFGYNGSTKVSTLFGASMAAGQTTAETVAKNDDYKLILHKTTSGTYVIESATHPGTYLVSTPAWGSTEFGWTATSVSALASTSDMSADYTLNTLVRFSKDSGANYFNSQGNITNWAIKSGTGEWSVWCVYEVTKTCETVTISDVGCSTYSSSRITDFSNIEGLEAFTCSGTSGQSLILNQVSAAVPAETGLFLRGEEGTYVIPYAETAQAVGGENYLVAVTEDTEEIPTEAGYTNYVLQNKNEHLAFYRVNPETQSIAMNAGHAYLRLPDSVSVKEWFDVDGGATNIDERRETRDERRVTRGFNLAGQRVGSDYTGIVIVNGKKVFNK